MRSPRDNRTERGILMSKTAYFMTDEEVRLLSELLGEKLDASLRKGNYQYYEMMQPVYDILTGYWVYNEEQESWVAK